MVQELLLLLFHVEEGKGESFGRGDLWGLMLWRCCGVDDDDDDDEDGRCGLGGGGVTMEEPRIMKSLILGQPFVSLSHDKGGLYGFWIGYFLFVWIGMGNHVILWEHYRTNKM